MTENVSKNDMSFINVVAIGIGSIVGAGIFALLGQVILISRLWTYASFLIAGIAAMFSGYSYAKLSAKFPVSGGLTDFSISLTKTAGYQAV